MEERQQRGEYYDGYISSSRASDMTKGGVAMAPLCKDGLRHYKYQDRVRVKKNHTA